MQIGLLHQLIGPELVQETTRKISQIKDRLKAARDRVVRFGKKRKLAPRFVGPFKIIEKKCLVDPTLQVPLDEIQVDAKLNSVEEPVEILEIEFKKLKRSRIAIVKILCRADGGDFVENYGDLWFIMINNPFWKLFSIFVSCVLIDHFVAAPELSFRHCRGVTDWIYVRGVPLLLAFACSRFGALVMSVIEMCELNIEYDWERMRI
ncbi:hypothetical protein Tco_0813442 [Tanacetum coccineum]